jgi:hypothetical protein
MTADLKQRVKALCNAGWLVAFTEESQHESARAWGEKYHRGTALREERETLDQLVPLLEEHERRLATEIRTSQVEAHVGLSNI